MKVRKFVMVLTLTVVAGGFGATRGLAHMKSTYDGACVVLGGVPGWLQKMHFFAQGNCRLSGSTTQCKDQGECFITTPSGKVTGKCRNMPQGCTCVPN